MITNDNDSTSGGAPPSSSPLPDAHGHAALLLVESLIHGLCERSTLTADQAVEIVERAANVQHDVAEEADGASAPMWQSHTLLSAIAMSLRTEGASGPKPPYLVT